MIFCICFCHVKGSPGGDRAPSVFLLMLLALTPRTITLPSGVLPELPGGAPPRLGTGLSGSSSRLVGQARHGLPRLGKDAGERASLKRGELAPRPRSKKWTSKPTECPGRHQKQRKQTECWGRKGASGMGRPQRGRRPLAEASRLSVSVFQRSLSLCSFTYLRLVLIVYTALCFCRLNVCSSHQSLPATYVLFGQGR